MALNARPPLRPPDVAIFDTEFPSSLTFLASLGARGVPVRVFGRGRFPPGRWSPHCVDAQVSPDPVQFDEFQDWLRARLREGSISRVAPTSDLLVYHCAVLRDAFPAEVRETIHTLQEVETALIKSKFNLRCEALGIAVPQTWYPESTREAAAIADELPYPVIIKPRSHLGIGMYYRGAIVDDKAAFLREFGRREAMPGQEPLLLRYPELHWPLVQRFLPNARSVVHSLCGLRDRQVGIVAEAGVCKTDQWPPGLGIGTSFTTVDDPATLVEGRRIVDGFLSHGLFQIEMLVDGDRRLAIDLNPRAYQMLSFDIARGNDLPWLWYRTTLGEAVPVQPPASLGLHWRRKPVFHLSHWTRLLGGPNRLAKWRRYRALLAAPSIGATLGCPWWVRLACEIRLLRHPRALVRPYWRQPE